MNIQLSVRPHINKFMDVYNIIYQTCKEYYDKKINDNQLKLKLQHMELYDLFTPDILNQVRTCLIAYTEAILILYLENRRPKYIQLLSRGTFNVVVKISLKLHIQHQPLEYALRLSQDDFCKINLVYIKDQNWYDNLLYYNDISLIKYLTKYPNVYDSCYYQHILDSNSYYTHWSISNIYQQISDVLKYRNKYILKVCELIIFFEKNELLYYDWKLTNFLCDNNDNLVLVDTDFENLYSLMAVCSTHRLTPDPAINLNRMDLKYKFKHSIILMYISAYLSIVAIQNSDNLADYYSTFKCINRFNININNQQTINSTINLISKGLFTEMPLKLSELNKLLKIIKNEFEQINKSYLTIK